MSNVKYTGHVGSGGLQGHSVGALYPYIVYGKETPEGTRYGVQNGVSGYDSGPQFDCAGAYQRAEFAKNRDTGVAMMRQALALYHEGMKEIA
jgi:hypothetical protein